MCSINSGGRVRRFGTSLLAVSGQVSARGGEVNLCELGEEGKKSYMFESSEERKSDESILRAAMVVNEQEVWGHIPATESYNVQITCFETRITCLH